MSLPAPNTSATTQNIELGDQRFLNLWTVRSRYQRGTICSVAITPGETWLVSSSYDSNLLFIEFKTGQLTGVLDLESRFQATALLWASESLLYMGCSNSVLFVLNYYPGTKHPITMRPILEPFNLPIKALALDPIRNFLAVGCGGDTYVFSRPLYGDLEAWEPVDHIPAPIEGHEGLVTSLEFRGNSTQGLLFIGHAKAGFCIWRGPHDYQRTPYEADGNVCTIGSAAFSSDGRFVAIVTLEHSIILYPMNEHGPVIRERHVVELNDEPNHFRPIVPIALGANNLVMRGTASGQVPIIDLSTNGDLAPIRNDPQEIIRTLTTRGDKLVVGMSDANGTMSKIKCFLDRASSQTAPIRVQHDADQPLFTVAIGDLEDLAGSYRTIDGLKFRKVDRMLKALALQLSTSVVNRLRSRRVWVTILSAWLFTLMLVVDPPALPGHTVNPIFDYSRAPEPVWSRPGTDMELVYAAPLYNHGDGFIVQEDEADGKGNKFATFTTPGYGSRFPAGMENGQPKTSDQSTLKQAIYPSLGSLFAYCGRFVIWRLSCWGSWFLVCGTILIGYTFTGIFYVLCIVPFLIKHAISHLPHLMVVALCEVLQAFGDIPICPKPNQQQ
ncbi:hypothetical protein FRC12_002848 [Ceratobasidium sp. 428]|nr:hypothetical protein FRC12_002848 [Ceratobasidium sp. 428]